VTPPARLIQAPLPEFDPSVVVDVDVRDDLRAGREPLARILAVADTLPDGSVLHLRTPFQPVPLYGVLGRLGFEYHSERFADDDWSAWFWRGELPPPPPADASSLPVDGAWDLRDLPAPEPLQRLVERIGSGASAFDALLPAYSDLLSSIIAQHGWHIKIVAASGSTVRVRLTRGTESTAER
jgi:hypothetical protein